MIRYYLLNRNQGIVKVITNDDGSTHHQVMEQHPDNTDYQNFKKQINADEAQLEDAEGTLMTAKAAKEYVATLP